MSLDLQRLEWDSNFEGYFTKEGGLIPDLKYKTNEILDIFKFIDNLEKINEINDFSAFKTSIIGFINESGIFNKALQNRNNGFIEGFEKSSIKKFDTSLEENSKEEQFELIKLLNEKNKLFLDIMSEVLKTGKLDNLLEEDEKNDLINTIDSGVFRVFDEINANWFNSINNKAENKVKDDNGTKIIEKINGFSTFGGLENGKFVPYKNFVTDGKINIKEEFLEKIKDKNLRQYLQTITGFLKNGIDNYHAWTGIEVLGLNSWINDKNSVGFLTAIEEYNNGVNKEAEFILLDLLRLKKSNFQKQDPKGNLVDLLDFLQINRML